MSSSLRLAVSASALLASALLVVGCASTPGSTPDSSVPPTSGTDDTSAPSTAPDAGTGIDDDIEAAWLDDGRMFAVMTWGSSTCVPTPTDVTADGQTVTVMLSEGDANQACTADFAPRASIAALPEGVDPTQDVELIVTLGSITDDVDLDGNAALTGIPGESTDFAPSAGWFDDSALVLLTWGSSSCPPVIDSVEASGAAGTVTFVTEDRACTMDMAPRGTLIDFGDQLDDDADDAFVLTLVGDNLDATVNVLEG